MKSNYKLILVVIGLVFLLSTVVALVYKEWAPKDNKAATFYYISPSGNDSTGNGSEASPWKTLAKADTSISSGDTVILKDGVYSGYVGLSKSNTTWIADNQHKAIIDGGFGPALLEGRWDRISEAYNSACNGMGLFVSLLSFGESGSNIIVDGLVIRNSCGRGLDISGDNITIQNSRVDWTLISGLNVDPNTSVGLKLLNNTFTRITFNDQLLHDTGQGYSVNISMYMRGDDMVIRGNTFAWGRGEMAMPFSKNMIFEDNVVVGMKNNFYIGWTHDTIARNNLFYSPETENTADTHWAYPFGNAQNQDKINWRISGRAEDKGDKIKGMDGPKNVQFYNNISINNSISFDGYHRKKDSNGDVESCFGNVFNGLYFGHNTIITRQDSDNLFHIKYNQCNGTIESANSSMIGLFENNIFDNSKNRDAGIDFNFDGNDNVIVRNNILPVGTSGYANNNIYSNNPEFDATVAELKLLHLEIPGIGVSMEEVDTQDLRNLVDLNRVRIKQNSPAINAGSTAGSPNSAQIPSDVRTVDFLGNGRTGLPDMGAIEYGGVYFTSTPSPVYSPAPTITPNTSGTTTSTPTPSNTPVQSVAPTATRIPGTTPTVTPVPTQLTGSICGQADIDNDVDFDIVDFVAYAGAYQDGKRNCDDKDVEYGDCGGRDVNRDGKLNIADFGGTDGFASRYYPKTSCSLYL